MFDTKKEAELKDIEERLQKVEFLIPDGPYFELVSSLRQDIRTLFVMVTDLRAQPIAQEVLEQAQQVRNEALADRRDLAVFLTQLREMFDGFISRTLPPPEVQQDQA